MTDTTIIATTEPSTIDKRRAALVKARATRAANKLKKTIGHVPQVPEPVPVARNPNTNTICYEPEDGGDPSTIMGGMKFRANIPVEVERTRTVLQLLVEKRELKDGTIVTQGVEKRIPLAEVLRGNRFFRVDGVKITVKAGVERVPDDPGTYRGYCQNWMRMAISAKELADRWSAEAVLRDKCGLAEQDLAYLMPFYEARHEMLSAVMT
jgi:hypothetical protein